MLKLLSIFLALFCASVMNAQSLSDYMADKPEAFKTYWNQYGCSFTSEVKAGVETVNLESLNLENSGVLVTANNFDPETFKATDYPLDLAENSNLHILIDGKGILTIPSIARSEQLWNRFNKRSAK